LSPRILFLLKFRDVPPVPGFVQTKKGLSSGLLNSARFVVDMLGAANFDVKLVQVVDNNSIDREVHLYKPTHVIVEALWVQPDKFAILQKLHPTVKWIVRGHSDIPFLAQEGVALDWITAYMKFENVSFGCNSVRSYRDIRALVMSQDPLMTPTALDRKILFLPNCYPDHRHQLRRKQADGYVDVCCFGAIRPLKNQLIQAVAATEYARRSGRKLRFHVNASRTEQRGDNVLKNLRALFNSTGNDLVEHPWMPHREFLHVLGDMDCALQVSFTETFNIVAADAVSVGLPVVGSDQIPWLSSLAMAQPTDSNDIVEKLVRVNRPFCRGLINAANLRGLRQYCEASRVAWMDYFNVSA
jgi:hypothetical protein